MECQRCHNRDPRYFYFDKNTYYCRKCVMFGRIDVNQEPNKYVFSSKKLDTSYMLPYALTTYQKEVVKKLNAYLKQAKDVLVYAATGAGKTEIVMQSIEDYLRAGKKVGVAISRRQVVLEIKERMQKAFINISVIAVCEGFTDIVDGDLIVCTMHQLYRYHQCFDLLIMDEVDAFPYYGNTVLEAIAKHACKGEIIYLSATPDAKMLQDINADTLKMVQLFKRPHGYPLIVPICIKLPLFLEIYILFVFLLRQKRKNKQTLVFVPTIRMANTLYMFFKIFFACNVITSKSENKDTIIAKMRKKEYAFLFTTTILERGITIPAIDVVILKGDHIVFNEASLIQICGRVGRSYMHPVGTCLLMCEQKSKDIKKCIHTIRWMNEQA